jgi:PAS domain S-box-containing protein
MGTKSMSKLKWLLITLLMVLAGMTVYEFLKHTFIPGLTLWESHIITIILSGVLATTTAYFILRTHERLYRRLDKHINEQKLAEEALRESEEKHRMLVDKMNDGLGVIDKDGTITLVNNKLCEMFGYSRDELLGSCVTLLLNEANKEVIKEQLAIRRKGGREHYEIEFRRKDGDGIPTIVSPEPIFDDDGNFIGSFAVITDITKRKRDEEEKERLQTQLVHSQKMEAIGTLAGGIAHDINNSMTSIKNMTALALNKLDEKDPMKGYLEPIREVSEKTINLVRQLLIFSQEKPPELCSLNLNDTICNLLPMLNSLLIEGITIKNELGHDLWDIEADKERIERIITNLVVNSIDAMPKGGKITLRTKNVSLSEGESMALQGEAQGNFVCLTVEDTGMGMDKESIGHIFEPFFTTKSPHGTGLGLSVVYGIVTELNGWVDVSSEPGQGSKFMVYLPASMKSK